jgi:hypothetical protein
MKNKGNKTKEFNRIFEKAAEEVLQENALAEKSVAPAVVPPHNYPRLQGRPKIGMMLLCNETTTRHYEVKIEKARIIHLVSDRIPAEAVGVCAMYLEKGKEYDLDDDAIEGGFVVVRWLTAQEKKSEEVL